MWRTSWNWPWVSPTTTTDAVGVAGTTWREGKLQVRAGGGGEWAGQSLHQVASLQAAPLTSTKEDSLASRRSVRSKIAMATSLGSTGLSAATPSLLVVLNTSMTSCTHSGVITAGTTRRVGGDPLISDLLPGRLGGEAGGTNRGALPIFKLDSGCGCLLPVPRFRFALPLSILLGILPGGPAEEARSGSLADNCIFIFQQITHTWFCTVASSPPSSRVVTTENPNSLQWVMGGMAWAAGATAAGSSAGGKRRRQGTPPKSSWRS